MKELLVLVVLVTTYIKAGATIIQGQILNTGVELPKYILFYRYYPLGDPDTAYVGSYGEFKLNINRPTTTLYRIQAGRSMSDVLANPNEAIVRLRIELRPGDAVIIIDDSKENEAHDALKSLTADYRKALADLRYKPYIDSFYYNTVKRWNKKLDEFIASFQGTFTAQTLAPALKYQPARTDISVLQNMQQTFLNGFDLSDTTILTTPFLTEMLHIYSESVYDTSQKAVDGFIKSLIQKAQASPQVYYYLSNTLLTTFYRTHNEKMLVAYNKWYNDNINDTLPPVIRAKLDRLKQVLPGQKFIDLAYKNAAGAEQKLSSVVAKSKLTLLIIWESECSHCRETLPEVKELYAQYRSKGFDVYGVSIDREEAPWKKYLTEAGIPWNNVRMDTNNFKNIEAYYVVSTPTLVLINNQGIIEHRLMDSLLLKQYVAELLN